MEANQLEVSSDSQLVVKQIEDSYEARGEKMILYLKKVRELLKKFIRVQVKHVLRSENSRANALAKLAIATRRPRQTDTYRAPYRTLSKRRQRRSLPRDVRTKLDGPHLGLLGIWYITKRPKGDVQTQSEVGKIHRSSRDPL